MTLPPLDPARRAALAAIGAFFVLGLVGLDAVPRMFGDESWYAMPTVSLLREGTPRLVALDGRGGVELAYLQPKLLPNLVALPIVAVAGVHLWAFRLAALLAGVAGLLGVEAIGRRRFGPETGLVAVLLLLGNFWFFAAARCFRPEVFELAALVWFFDAFERALEGRRPGAVVAAGLAAAAAALSHQVSLAVVAAVALSLLAARPSTRGRWIAACQAALVALAALAPYLVYVAVASRRAGVSFTVQLTGEAIHRPLSLRTLLLWEANRWMAYFLWPLGAPAAVVSLAALVRARRGAADGVRAVALVVVLGAGVLTAFVPILTGRYVVILAPFLALLVAREVVALRRRAAASPGASWPSRLAPLAVALALCGPSLAVMAGAAALHRGASYGRFTRSLRAVTGDAPAAGPVAFWLGYSDVPYTVTNVAPDFVPRAPSDAPWLGARIARGHPRYILETTTELQATDGLAARPVTFPRSTLGDLAARVGTVVAVVASRDFGPVRIWRVGPP